MAPHRPPLGDPRVPPTLPNYPVGSPPLRRVPHIPSLALQPARAAAGTPPPPPPRGAAARSNNARANVFRRDPSEPTAAVPGNSEKKKKKKGGRDDVLSRSRIMGCAELNNPGRTRARGGKRHPLPKKHHHNNNKNNNNRQQRIRARAK